MTLVIDASVAVKWMIREPGNDAARSLFDLPDPLIAPDWLLVEAASTFWKKVKSSELLEIHAKRHIEDLPNFFSRLFPASSFVAQALELSFRLRHAVYDCLYLALALRENCRLVTADAEFYGALKRHGLEEHALLLEY
jgi:predicted nucleic acid-binding protein